MRSNLFLSLCLSFEKLSFVFVFVFVFFVFWRGEQNQKYFEVLDGILEGGKKTKIL